MRPAQEEQATESSALTDDSTDSAEGDTKPPGRLSMLLVGGLGLIALAVATSPPGVNTQSKSEQAVNTQSKLEQGVAAYNAGNLDQAKRLYEDVLEKEPANVIAHFNLGVAEQEAGNNAQAEEHYREALRGNEQFAHAMFNLAILLDSTGRPEQAAETYERLLESHPDESRAHINLGFLYIEKLDRQVDGEAHFRQALKLDPNLISRIPHDLRPVIRDPLEKPPASR